MRIRSLATSIIVCLASTNAMAQWQALPEQAPAPADNPTTAEKVELGKMLFFDPRISSTGTISCASCHNVMEGGDDHRPTSMGVHGLQGGRNAPTVRSEEHTSELQSLMRISYAVFCLKKKKTIN